MSFEQVLIDEYFKTVDLRAKVLDGTATEWERKHYFNQMTIATVNLLHAISLVGIEYNVSVCTENGHNLAAGMDALAAYAIGAPGVLIRGAMERVGSE